MLSGLAMITVFASCDSDDAEMVRVDPGTIAASNIIAYFPFDREPAGGAAVEFSRETIRFVRSIGGGTFVEGRNGNAYQGSIALSSLEFDVTRVSVFTTLEEFTLSCWLKTPATASGSSKIFGINGGDTLMGNIALIRESRPTGDSVDLRLYFYSDSSQNNSIRISTAEFLNNEWFHLAALYHKDSSRMEFYVNGNPVFSGSAAGNDSTSPLPGDITFRNDISKIYFGAWEQQLTGTPEPWMSFFDGLIDEFRIFNKALSGEELFNLYEAELSQVDK